MDRQTAAIYKRGAIFVVPVVLFVGCRVGLRACVALSKSDARHAQSEAISQAAAEEQKKLDQAMLEEEQRKAAEKRARAIAKPAEGQKTKQVATAQQVPDALVANDAWLAWMNTRSGDVVLAPRNGASRIVAKKQELPRRRHAQTLALANGYLYWVESGSSDDVGGIHRAKVDRVDGSGEIENVVVDTGGITALAVDKGFVWFTRTMRERRDENDKPTGGLYKIAIGQGARSPRPSEAMRVLAAEAPCGVALDDAAAYVIEDQQIWRLLKSAKEGKTLVKGGDRLGCSLAVDDTSVYWTIPQADSVMRAKKTDGSAQGVLAFVRKRPWNVVVDRGYAYVLTETSPQALGELGSVFRVALRADPGSETALPLALVVDRVGLNSIAAAGGTAFLAGYDENESDGVVEELTGG
jgi:hypothetical protein